MSDIVGSSFGHVNPKRHYIFDLPDARRAAICREDFWVPHPAATYLIQKINMMLEVENKTQAPCMVCCGDGGSGKTSHVNRLKQEVKSWDKKLIFVTMHQNPNNYSLKQLILSAMGVDFSRQARAATNITPQMQAIIKRDNIKGVVIDEVHDALTLTDLQQRINLSLLKNLSGSEYGLSVFAFGIGSAQKVLRADPQLERRYAVHDIKPFSYGEEYRNFVSSYVYNLPLKYRSNIDGELLLLLHKKTHGLVDNIVKALQASASYAVLNGDERIKKEHITNVDVLLDMFGMSMSSYD
ncbi:TniB family NTP-binding protein [Pseudomonas fluorescens]|uniref:TniB family NTP-binding protein n=1 Tax=Pseudomonas fluorescens TaxID=294 RepID=UPI002181F588|nr:TniB family NTP-binding protein [Pseudomonas fluorescens]